MPKILVNAKDHPDLPSGYGIIVRNLCPLLADHYGRENIIIYAPVYQRDYVGEFEGMKVLPGVTFDFGENMILPHYQHFNCDMLLQIGDAWPLGVIPDLAARNDIYWLQWLPVDWLGMPKNIMNRIKYANKLIPFSKDAEARLRKADLKNIEPAIWLGLNTEIWQPAEREPEMMRLLGFEEDTFNILVVSANQERKNMREQLAAVKLFRQVKPESNPRLYLHTQMRRERDLYADIDDLDLGEIVTYNEEYQVMLGGVGEKTMARIFNCADVVLNCCHEGFGYATLQAQAVGVPVIFLAEGPSTELVKFGQGIPPIAELTAQNMMTKAWPSPIDIAIALEKTWVWRTNAGKPPRSEKAIQFVKENFSWEKIATQWIEIIDKAVADKERYCLSIPAPSEALAKKSEEAITL